VNIDKHDINVDISAIDMTTAFYDVMFGDKVESGATLNEIEEYVYKRIELISNKEMVLSKYIRTLPQHQQELSRVLQDESPAADEIFPIIKKDLLMTGEIIKASNDPRIRRTANKITDFDNAIEVLGVDGVIKIVKTILLRKVVPVNRIYFKRFGQQIWNHSLEVAKVCSVLASRSSDDISADLAYTLGLIHDTGKIIIFELLVEAFSATNPDSRPGSKIFKRMMEHSSMQFSARIAQEWELPSLIVVALEQQLSRERDCLAEILHQANIASEVHMMVQADKITFEQGKRLFVRMGLEEDLIFAMYGGFANQCT